jgi:hypothetical protein
MGAVTVPSKDRLTFFNLIKRDIFILNIGLGIGYVLLWGYTAYQGLFIRADFTNFYTAGAIVRDGLGRDLYDQALQTQYQQRILNGLSFQDGVLMYISPPQAVFPFVGLSFLPLKTAYWVWGLVEAGLLVWFLRLLGNLLKKWQKEERRLLISAVCAFPLLLITFMQGAFSLFVLICLIQFYITLKNKAEARAGFWLAIGFLKPQNMLLVLVLLVAARRWKTLAAAGITGAGIFGITSLLFGWRIWLDFISRMATFSSYFDRFGVAPEKMYNFKGELTLLFGSGQAALINQTSWVALGVAAVVVLLIWSERWQPEKADFELRLALTLTLGLLFSTYLYAHDALLLVLPAILFLIYLRESNLPLRRFAVFCAASPYLFLMGEYIFDDRLYIRVAVFMMAVFIAWLGTAAYNEHHIKHGHLSIKEAS